MKIAQISTSWMRTPPLKYGGTEAIVSSLTEQLVELGHEVTLFATGDSLTKARLWSFYDSPTYNFELKDEILHFVKAYEYISKTDFDIIHNHTYTIGPAFLSLASRPSLTTTHTADKLTYYKAFSKEHAFVSVSQHQQKLMPEVNWLGTVHNAINVADFPFEENKDDYLLFIGNITPKKCPHLAIQVAKKLGMRLKLAGPSFNDYYQRVILPDIDNHTIEYLGEVNFHEKAYLYQHATALLVPLCWEEPFGMVMIEALACGTPVIAFARGAASEIIIHGQVGFVVDNVDEMVEAVRDVKQIDPKTCRFYVEHNFDIKLMTKRYIEIYSKIIDSYGNRTE